VEAAAVVDLALPIAFAALVCVWLASRRRLPWVAAGVATGAVLIALTVSGLLVFGVQMANFD
jgi:hypothetical protein